MIESVGLFFFNAATIPNRIPNGTENIVERIINNIDTGIHDATTSAYYKRVTEDYIPTSNPYDFVEAEFTAMIV